MKARASVLFGYWLPVVLWRVVIFSLSSLPGELIPDVPVPFFDKIGHLFEFGILGVLLIRALIRSWPRIIVLKLSVWAVAGSVLFGISDEWHQAFVPGRSSEWGEVLWDGIFSIAGMGLFFMGRRIAGGRRLP